MDREISRWIDMLTGTIGDAADPTASSLEEACRAAEAQIASLQNGREPGDLLAELEARVAELTADHKSRLRQRADLEKQAEQALEQRRAKILARLQAAVLSDAQQTIDRANAFFAEDFSDKTPAQIEQARSRIARRLASARAELDGRIMAAVKLLQEQQPALAQNEKYDSERKLLQDEIRGIEQTLSEQHQCSVAVLDSLRAMTVDELTVYHDDVIQVRLKDARFEAARGLRLKIWEETFA